MFGYKEREIEEFRDQLMKCPQLVKQLKEDGSGDLAEKGLDELFDKIQEIVDD